MLQLSEFERFKKFRELFTRVRVLTLNLIGFQIFGYRNFSVYADQFPTQKGLVFVLFKVFALFLFGYRLNRLI